MKQASRDLALCGVLCALAVAIMAMGTILPAATYCAPVLASMTLLPVLVLCGEKLSWAMFFASAMLSLLLAPVADGDGNSPAVFERSAFSLEGLPVAFQLKSVEQLRDSGVRLVYTVKNGHPGETLEEGGTANG